MLIKTKYHTQKSAFTLIELLVVMSIISVLVGLMLPAVQKARGAVNRISCANSLKQVGLSMWLYHSTFDTLPATRVSDQGASWAVLILPNLEQENLYRKWDTSKTYYQQSQIARETGVKVMFCPERRSPAAAGVSIAGDVDTISKGQHVPGALSDYAVNMGTESKAASVSAGYFHNNDGAFPTTSGRGINFNMIRDGLSNTLLAGEKHVPVSKWGVGGYDSSIYNGDIYLSISRVASPQHRIATTVDDTDWRFGSYHFGIIQFAFCDGGVRSVAVNISEETFRRLASRNDGEVLSDY